MRILIGETLPGLFNRESQYICMCVIVRMSPLTFSAGVLVTREEGECKFEIAARTRASSEFTLIPENGRGCYAGSIREEHLLTVHTLW